MPKMQTCISCCRENGNVRAALRMYHAQFPDRRMPDHRTFQRLHRQLHGKYSFHGTKHDAGRKELFPVQAWKKAP
ncbi:hypothetical protein TNCV_2742281 [Trichonephila clavipes]|nr:hypothetical protein TNCV_2742281 [Trichonephila clavipes]